MEALSNNIVEKFLAEFFAVFDAKVSRYSINGRFVEGAVFWEDEDPDDNTQDFRWYCTMSNTEIVKFSRIFVVLHNENLVDIDKLTISEEGLLARVQPLYPNQNEAVKYIDLLCSFSIRMVDEGKETDYFFIHL